MEYLRIFEERLPTVITHLRDEILHGINEPDNRSLVLSILNLCKPLYLEGQQFYLHFGEDAAKRYNTQLFDFFSSHLDYLNKMICNEVYAHRIKQLSQSIEDDYPRINRENTAIEYAVLINRMYFHLLRILHPYSEGKPRKPEQRTKPESIYTQPIGSSKNQWGIILHFIQEASLTHLDRPTLTKLDRGSRDLYNIICKVRKGEYKTEDLQKAIDFLSTSPVAQALAATALSKKHHSKKS